MHSKCDDEKCDDNNEYGDEHEQESNDEDGVHDYSDSDQSDSFDNDPLYSPTPKKKRKKSLPQAPETDVEQILSTIKSHFSHACQRVYRSFTCPTDQLTKEKQD